MMETLNSIFPASREWPPAIDDVVKAPLDSTSIRLISGAQKFDKLPSYGALKALWCFDIDEKKLRSICECATLESLYVENVKTENLGCLDKLVNLKILGVESCSKATSLTAFHGLQSLSGLAITHFKNVHDLRPLANLRSLRALAVAGSMWTRMQVDTLKPLEELKGLELLHLTNIKAEDESLSPLAALQNLRQLDIANFYPMSEFARLSQRLRTTRCAWFQP
jgi:Leucine-rich repeat (LRR) protein